MAKIVRPTGHPAPRPYVPGASVTHGEPHRGASIALTGMEPVQYYSWADEMDDLIRCEQDPAYPRERVEERIIDAVHEVETALWQAHTMLGFLARFTHLTGRIGYPDEFEDFRAAVARVANDLKQTRKSIG